MGRVNKYFKVGGLRFLQALTPRECYSRFIVASPSGPLSRHRERGWGERADAPAATLGAYLCAVRTMLLHRSYPALQATERGSSRGNLSPLTRFCLLLAVQKEAPAG